MSIGNASREKIDAGNQHVRSEEVNAVQALVSGCRSLLHNCVIKHAAMFCVVFVGIDLMADGSTEIQPYAGKKECIEEEQDAARDTIAQINHINWVWNTIKTYNNSVVFAEEYDKISPGNLNLNRIPDEDTLRHIMTMLDTLHSLSIDV